MPDKQKEAGECDPGEMLERIFMTLVWEEIENQGHTENVKKFAKEAFPGEYQADARRKLVSLTRQVSGRKVARLRIKDAYYLANALGKDPGWMLHAAIDRLRAVIERQPVVVVVEKRKKPRQLPSE